MATHYFTGTTQGGTELRLWGEHTEVRTHADDDGNLFELPGATRITGTLNGEPIDIDGIKQRWSDGAMTVLVISDRGTFTADSEGDIARQRALLRDYLRDDDQRAA